MDRIRSIILPVAALVFGLAGAILRRLELAFVYDASGLPITGHPLTLAMALLSALFVVILVLGAVLSVKPAPDYGSCFSGDPVACVIHTASGIILAAAAVAGIISAQGDLFLSLSLYLLALAGLCICCHGVFCLVGKEGQPPSGLLLVPVFCVCIRLIYVFKGWSADPSIVDYIYELLAIILISISLFMASGFIFDSCRPRLTAAVSLCGIYFSLVTFLNVTSPDQKLFFIFSALYMLSLALRMTGPRSLQEASESPEQL